MKRLLLVSMIATLVGTFSTTHAQCTEENRGGSAGPYDTAGVTYGDLEITAWTYGNFATGPMSLCSDGTTHAGTAHGDFRVTRDGEIVCSSNDPTFRITSDPFGFGASITGTGDGCSVAISFDGITATPGADASDVGADPQGANAGVRKNAPVKDHGEGGTDASTVTLGDEVIEIPNGTMGYFTKGARAQSEH